MIQSLPLILERTKAAATIYEIILVTLEIQQIRKQTEALSHSREKRLAPKIISKQTD